MVVASKQRDSRTDLGGAIPRGTFFCAPLVADKMPDKRREAKVAR
jgi:hypothetical protein